MKVIVSFTAPKKSNLITETIFFFQGLKTSHSVVIFPSDYGKRLVYESKGLGERLISYENLLEDNFEVNSFEVILPEGLKDSEVFNHVYERIGYHYSYLQLVGYAYCVFMKKLFNKTVQNPFKDGEKHTTCHETVMIFLRDVCKFDELKGLNFDNLDLKWFYDFCHTSQKMKKVF